MAQSYDLGDLIPLAVSVTDSTGVAANATTVVVTIVQPDGTSLGPYTPTNSATGSYTYTFTPTLTGHHTYRFQATGTNASTYAGAFNVLPSVAPVVTLDEIKAHLSLVGSSDDAELAAFLAASIPVIESIVGPIIPKVITAESHNAGSIQITTNYRPLISVESITEMVGMQSRTLTLQPVGSATDNYGYSIDSYTRGLITRRGTGSLAYNFGLIGHGSGLGVGTVLISYTAGRSVIPENVRFMVKELVKYMWRQVKGGQASFQDGSFSQAATSGISEAMMARLRFLAGNETTVPGIA
jgi:hypothetical protein